MTRTYGTMDRKPGVYLTLSSVLIRIAGLQWVCGLGLGLSCWVRVKFNVVVTVWVWVSYVTSSPVKLNYDDQICTPLFLCVHHTEFHERMKMPFITVCKYLH